MNTPADAVSTPQATYGQYNNQMNPKAGVLLCLNNFSPAYYIAQGTAEKPAPPLNKFTDILWFQWLDAAGDNVGNVKYFYRHHVADDDSKEVLDAIEAMPGVRHSLTLLRTTVRC